MNGLALYNEIDEFAAGWLEQLIFAGHIAPGIVDRRSIEDLDPAYVGRFTQVHFFAGIGVWSYALRRAGWPDDRPVWTASEPCQPFSAAGKGGGFADERYLRPYAQHLIRECRPAVVLGEQVASKDGLAWLDVIQADLEGEDYAFGAVDTCAAGFGAPHIRQRLYWCAMADPCGPGPQELVGRRIEPARPSTSRAPCSVAQPHDAERRSDLPARHFLDGTDAGRPQGAGHAGFGGGLCGLADHAGSGRREERQDCRGLVVGDRAEGVTAGSVDGGGDSRPGPTNGFWRDADWLGCRDERWRPVEPGTFPLAHGAAARVGRLRGYGNAIVAPQAEAFASSVMEYLNHA